MEFIMSNLSRKFVVGVDVSKETLDVCDSQKNHQQIKNNCSSIKRYLNRIMTKQNIDLLVMEATGGYEKTLRWVCTEKNIPFHVAHPNQVYHFKKACGALAKTDKLDAEVLAKYGEQEEITANQVSTQKEEELKELVQRKIQLKEQIQAEKSRESCSLYYKGIKQSCQRIIKSLEKELKLINSTIKRESKEISGYQEKQARLKSFKGVGEEVSESLLILVPELGKVTRNEISALLGVAPYNRDSGKWKGKRSIRGGRFEARKLLYMSALVSIRYNPRMKTYYEELRNRGKIFKVAIVAVMRKIICTLNAMLRDGVNWSI